MLHVVQLISSYFYVIQQPLTEIEPRINEEKQQMLHHLLVIRRRTKSLHMMCNTLQRVISPRGQHSSSTISEKTKRNPCILPPPQDRFKCHYKLTPLCRQFLLRSSVPACQMIFSIEWLLAWLLRNQSRIILLLIVIVKMRIQPSMTLTRILIPWQGLVTLKSVGAYPLRISASLEEERHFLVSETSLAKLLQHCDYCDICGQLC